ncbi:Tuberous sclerosis 2-like protein, partial [Ascosphaera atra]
MEGRGPRVTFGLESLHRASQALSSSLDSSNDTHGHPPDYNALLRGLDKDNCTSVASAVEDCETAARWIRRCWNTEQALGLWNVANWLVREPGSTAEAVEGRKAAASLLKNLADRHDVSYDAREKLLASIATDVPPEALPELVDPLQAITEHGRKIDFVDVPLLPVITSWIVPLYEVTASYRSRLRRGQKPPYVVNEEALRVLFEFTETIVTLLCKPPSLEYAEALFNQIFVVCRRTGVVADIKQALSVFDSFIGIPCIPDGSFVTLIEVLCSIQAAIKNLAGSTSRTVRNLAKSGKSTEMVSTLFAFIRETGENERPLHIIRGAVNFLSDLLVTYGQDRTPEMDYDTLITTLECATLRNDSKIDASVLEVCLDMLRSSYVDVVLTHNISGLIEVIVQCSHKPSDQPPRSPATPDSQSSLTRCFHGDDTRYNVSAVMTRIIETFETLWPRLSQEQRGNVTVLFISAHS